MKMSKAAAVRIDSRPREPSIPPAVRYRLSDITYKLMGWTKESSSAVAYPVVIMRAKFANRNISPWFRPRNKPLIGNYPSGTKAYIAAEDGTGKIYYPNKELAARIVKGGRYKERTRIWLYDTTEVGLDGMKHPHKICAVFDSLGNGIVYDQYMNKRLLYNQSSGMIVDTPSNAPVFWKWHDFASSEGTQKNEDTESSTSATDKRRDISITSHKRRRPASDVSNKIKSMSSVKTNTTSLTMSDRDFAADEINYINTGKLLPLKVSPIKPIAFRINRYFSLRIFSQSEIVLTFYAEGLHTVLKIGVLYSPYDKLRVIEIEDPALLSEKVLCPIEFYPEKTGSMIKFRKILQDKKMKKVQAPERKINESSPSTPKDKKRVTISRKIGRHQKTKGTMTPVDLHENRMYVTRDDK